MFVVCTIHTSSVGSCPSLPKIPHGSFTSIENGKEASSVALYSCDYGYQITLSNQETAFVGKTECVNSSWSNLIPCQSTCIHDF